MKQFKSKSFVTNTGGKLFSTYQAIIQVKDKTLPTNKF